LNAVVLEAAGLLLVLWETFPKVPDIVGVSKKSFISLASSSLCKLSANKVTQGLLEDESPIERESKGFFWPLTDLFSKNSHPKAYRTAFFHTSALLHSANGSKSI
jgi:hypothetical protein